MTISNYSPFLAFPVDIIEHISEFLNDPNDVLALREVYGAEACGKSGDELRRFIEEPTYWNRHFRRMFSMINLPASSDDLCEMVCHLSTRFFGFRPAYGLTPYTPTNMKNCIASDFHGRVSDILTNGYEQCVLRSPLMKTPLCHILLPVEDLMCLFDAAIKDDRLRPALQAFLLCYHEELQKLPELQCHVAALRNPDLCTLFLGDKPASSSALTKAVMLDNAEALKRLAQQPGDLRESFDLDKALRMAVLIEAKNVIEPLIELGADPQIAEKTEKELAEHPKSVPDAPENNGHPLPEQIESSIPAGQFSWEEAFRLLFSQDSSMLTKPMHRYTQLAGQIHQLTTRFYKQNPSASPFYINLNGISPKQLYNLFKEALDAGYEQFFAHNYDILKAHKRIHYKKLHKLATHGVFMPHRHKACRAFLRVYRQKFLSNEKVLYNRSFYNKLCCAPIGGMQTWSVILNDIDVLSLSCKQQHYVDIGALRHAVQMGRIDACKFFLETKKIPPNQKLSRGLHLLQVAASWGADDVVALLIQKGADLNTGEGSDKGTPLHQASSLSTLQQLVQAGADIEAVDDEGRTPLHWAARVNHLEIVQLLIDKNAQLDVVDCDGVTPLSLAACYDAAETVTLLAEAGASVNIKDNEEWTALHAAAYNKNLKLAQYLLDKGADPSAMHNSGWTPLHIAAGNNAFDLVNLLLERGSCISAETSSGETPFALAKSEDVQELLQVHIEKRKAECPPEEEPAAKRRK